MPYRTAPQRHNGHAGRPHFGPMPTLEREIRDFGADVLERPDERVVLAEFWAPWCAACRRLHPALENVAARFATRVALVSVNIEMHDQVLEPQRVHGLPLVKAYFRGRAIGEMSGVLPEREIRDWVRSLFAAVREAGMKPAWPEGPAEAPAPAGEP
jgi:putative thioredoxin